ncbi:hypothetical protein JB92DRAFT_3146385 [Gautieria morchelliformis]|nr:hypothetical protein JB92DRAFT_3146385 [Gautieria morchelliformis]
MSLLGSPLKRKRGLLAGTRKLQRQAEKNMTPAEVQLFWRTEKEQRERRNSQLWATELAQQEAEAFAETKRREARAAVAEAERQFALQLLAQKLQGEATGLSQILSRHEFKSVTAVLESFHMDKLLQELEDNAPVLLRLLGGGRFDTCEAG